MSIYTSLILIFFSFYAMYKVMDMFFIKSLDRISDKLKLTPSVAGATLMAFGTSAPELSTALIAFFMPGEYEQIGLGSIVGSALFQTLVVIGFAAIVHKIHLDWKPVMRDVAFYAFAIILLIISVQDGKFTLTESMFFVITYFIYLSVLFSWSELVNEKVEPDSLDILEEEHEKFHTKKSVLRIVWDTITKPVDLVLSILPNPEKNPKWTLPVFIGSLVIIAYLSYLLVLGSESLAISIGIHPAVVALTILAGGGSLPELIGSAVVSKKGRGDMSVSNAIGSNIFDILISLGLPVFLFNLIHGDLHNIGMENIHTSIFLLFATLAAVIALFITRHFDIGKHAGWMLIGTYVLYAVGTYFGIV